MSELASERDNVRVSQQVRGKQGSEPGGVCLARADLRQDLFGELGFGALVELESHLAQGGLATPHALAHHLAEGQGLVCQPCPSALQAYLKQAPHEPAG
jgi:hypothetical protein